MSHPALAENFHFNHPDNRLGKKTGLFGLDPTSHVYLKREFLPTLSRATAYIYCSQSGKAILEKLETLDKTQTKCPGDRQGPF